VTNFLRILILLAFLTSAYGQGRFLVIPQESEHIKGDTGWVAFTPIFQQLIGPSEFPVGEGEFIRITAIAFRREDMASGLYQGIVPKIEFWMSTNPRPLGDTKQFPGENYGPDRQLVFSAENVNVSARPASEGVPPPFDFRFELTNPYAYRGAFGNLVIDGQFSTSGSRPDFDGKSLTPDRARFVSFGPGPFGGSEWHVDSSSLVTQFEYEIVPEPSILALIVFFGVIFIVGKRT
jgi:hypothetical protein